jgi:hypothetical protein
MSRRAVAVMLVVAVLAVAAAAFLARQPRSGPRADRVRSTSVSTTVVARAGGEPAPAATEEGARQAALSTVVASQRWLYLDDQQLAAEVRALATAGAAERLAREEVEEVGVAREALAKSPGRVWWLVRPLAWRVDAFSTDEAQVSVWALTVLSASDVAVPQSDWLTVTVELAWVDGRWLVDGIKDQPGPTPATGMRDEPWQPEPFDDALAGFTRIDGAP